MHNYKKYLFATAFLLLSGSPAIADEIFHWVDEDGVLHFSDWAPKNSDAEVIKMIVSNSNPPGYDPNEDQNSILGQAERVNERWAELKERQDERRKQRLELEQQQRRQYAVEYDYPYYSGSYLYSRPAHRPGFGHRPPFRVQKRQFAALDQLGLTGMRPHSINSSAHLARINAGKTVNGNFQPQHPGKMHHAPVFGEL